MTLHQLKVFLAVAKHSSITKASQELHISEPSVYQQVKLLQNNFGRSFYTRVGRGIELTTEGRAFFTKATEVLRKADELERQFTEGSLLTETESIVIGGSQVLSASVLANLLVAFKSRRPDVQLHFRTESSPIIERLVISNKVDFGLITNATSTSQLIIEPFRQEEMVVIISRQHPLARQHSLALRELARGPLIIRGRKKSSSQQILDDVKRQGFQLNIFMKCDSPQGVKVAVARGLGLGLLYRNHVEQEIKRGELKIIQVPDLKKYIQSFIIYKAGKPLLPAAQELLELLRQSRDANPTKKRSQKTPNAPMLGSELSKILIQQQKLAK
jgi:DNA-binding transcriptional LysR family regulator